MNIHDLDQIIKFPKESVYQITKVESIMYSACFNMESNLLYNTFNSLTLLTGQIPHIIYAKKSYSNFKVKKGAPIGLIVTLRNPFLTCHLNNILNLILPSTISTNSNKFFSLFNSRNQVSAEASLFSYGIYLSEHTTAHLQIKLSSGHSLRNKFLFSTMVLPLV